MKVKDVVADEMSNEAVQKVVEDYADDHDMSVDALFDWDVRVPQPTFSSSLLDQDDECPRRNWFNKASEVEADEDDEESPFLRRGRKLHEAIEDYLLGKTDRVKDGLAAQHDHLDVCRAKVQSGEGQVEDWLSIDLGQLGRFTGKIDFQWTGALEPITEYPGLIDWKSTSKESRIKSRNALVEGTQPLSYAYSIFQEVDAEALFFAYDYFLTQGPARTERTKDVLPRAYVEKRWDEQIFPKCVKIFLDFQKPKAKLVPGNSDACRWCPFQGPCTIQLEEVVGRDEDVPGHRPQSVDQYDGEGETMDFDKDSFLSQVQNNIDGGGSDESEGPQIDSPETPKPDPTPKTTDGRETNELDETGLTPTLVEGLKEEHDVTTKDEAARLTDDQVLQINGVGPAKLEKFRAVFPNPSGDDGGAGSGIDGSGAEPDTDGADESDSALEAMQSLQSQTSDDDEDGRDDEQPDVDDQNGGDSVGGPARDHDVSDLAGGGDDGGRDPGGDVVRLYVDCMPVDGRQVAELADLPAFHEACSQVVDFYDGSDDCGPVIHYKSAPYGKGPAEVAALFVDSGAWRGRSLKLDSDSPVDMLVYEQLKPHADRVVRGIA